MTCPRLAWRDITLPGDDARGVVGPVHAALTRAGVLSGGTIGDVPAWRAVAGSPSGTSLPAGAAAASQTPARQRGVCAAPRCELLLSRAISGAALPSHAGRLSSPAAGLGCGGGFRRAGNWPPSKPAAWQPGHPAPATAAPHPLQPGQPAPGAASPVPAARPAGSGETPPSGSKRVRADPTGHLLHGRYGEQ